MVSYVLGVDGAAGAWVHYRAHRPGINGEG